MFKRKRIKIIDAVILLLFVAYLAFYMKDHVSAVLSGFDLASTANTTIGKIISISLLLLANIRSLKSKSKVPQKIKIAFVCWCFYIPISNLYNQVEFSEVINITFQQWLWPSIFIYFYHYSQDDYSTLALKVLFFILTLFMSFQVYLEAEMIRTNITVASMLQVNEIYYLVLMLPWILLFEGKYYKVIKIVLFILILWLTFYSLKRTAMVAVAFAVAFYLFAIFRQGKMKLSTMVTLCVVLYIGYNLLLTVNTEFDGRIFERFGSMEEDKGSGRLEIFEDVINAISNFDVFGILFGGGRGNIGQYTHGYSAHNEYLEVLFSWGIVGLLLYILFIMRLTLHYIREGAELNIYPLKLASIGIFLAMSLTSHLVIYPYLFCILTSFWGFCLSPKKQ